MARNIKYEITIELTGNTVGQVSIGTIHVPYYLGQGNMDRIKFLKKKIMMELYRGSVYSESDIISKANNTINSQIIKVLLLYYFSAVSFPSVKKIEIGISSPRRPNIARYIVSNLDIKYIFHGTIDRRSLVMHINPKPFMYEESRLGNRVRIALSSWLLAMNTTDRHLCFNRLWIAFNSLFAYFGNRKVEHDNLIYMRQQIEANHLLFPHSKNLISAYNAQTLRNKYRWLLLCKNDIKRGAARRLLLSIQTFRDGRIRQLFSGVLLSHTINPFINTHPEYMSCINHVSQPGVSNDIELVSLLGIKYAYFLRNQRQHGLIVDPAFRIHDIPEDAEIDNVNNLLSVLIFELICNADRIPVQP